MRLIHKIFLEKTDFIERRFGITDKHFKISLFEFFNASLEKKQQQLK